VVIERPTLPGEAQYIEDFFKGARPLGIRQADGLELAGPIALAQPHIQAPAAQVVQHGEVFGQTQRMAVERRHGNALTHAAIGRRRRHRSAGHDGRGAVAILLAVVFADPDIVDAAAARFSGELQPFAIGPVPWLAQIRTRLEIEQDAKTRNGCRCRA
jgi:hypothetical protein